MTTSTAPAKAEPGTAWRLVLTVVLLAVAVAAGVLSVYSDTRAKCAVWMAVALVLAVAGGASGARSNRPRT